MAKVQIEAALIIADDDHGVPRGDRPVRQLGCPDKNGGR